MKDFQLGHWKLSIKSLKKLNFCNHALKTKIKLLKHTVKPLKRFRSQISETYSWFSHHRSSLSHQHPAIPKLGVYSLPPFVAVCLTNCGKIVYTQFLKMLCRLDRHIILGRIMHDMNMIYCTRTYNINFKGYIALARTMWIFENTLHSDVQCDF